MKKNSKQYILATVFFIIEFLFFLRFRHENKEMFFMVWAFIHLTFILYNFLNLNPPYNINKIGKNETTRYGELSNSFNEISNIKNTKYKRTSNGFLGVSVFFLIINIIGYLIFMIK